MLGPGPLESADEARFCHERCLRGVDFERQRTAGIVYEGLAVDCGYPIDVLVRRTLVVELEAQPPRTVERLLPIHAAQVLTYMKLSGARVRRLVNFNVPSLRRGLRRLSLPPDLLPDLSVNPSPRPRC